MIGAPYEFDRGDKTKEFPLFCKHSHFTDDSVMTVAVAGALLNTIGKSDKEIKAELVKSMQKWGHAYPNAGYGGMFYRWLRAKDPQPYNSYGNGSAMRVSAAGWLFDTLEETIPRESREPRRLQARFSSHETERAKTRYATSSSMNSDMT